MKPVKQFSSIELPNALRDALVVQQFDAHLNNVYLIELDGKKYILKIASGESRSKELRHEVKLLNELQNIIKVPKLVDCGASGQYFWVLTEFIDGIIIEKNTLNHDILAKLANILKKLHNTCVARETDYDFLLRTAKDNMKNNRLDKAEFLINGEYKQPSELLQWLNTNKPTSASKAKLLHGDFRPKNMIVRSDNIYLIDFGLSFIGDEYYDLAVFKYYLTDDDFAYFCEKYGIDKIDEGRLYFAEILSKFLNV